MRKLDTFTLAIILAPQFIDYYEQVIPSWMREGEFSDVGEINLTL